MTRLEFSTLVQRETRPLRNYAYQLTRNPEDANDLVQETVLKALSCHNRFMEGSNLKGWLYIIMKNSFINNYRRTIKRNMVIDNSGNNYYLDQPPLAIENAGEQRFIRKDLEQALDSLPYELHKIFRMNHKGFKYHEIAAILNIPIGTVKTRIFVARKLLRKKLGSYGKALGYKTD